MPGTNKLLLTPEERWERWEQRAEPLLVLGGIVSLIAVIAVYFVTVGGLVYWLVLEIGAAFIPQECFNTLTCEVLDVTKSFIASSGNICSDVFTYTWTPVDSAVVLRQEEVLQRELQLGCLNASAVGLDDARFKSGEFSKCFRIRDLYVAYVGAFNCAETIVLNNSSGQPCQSILPITSSHDPTLALVIAPLIVLLAISVCLYWWCFWSEEAY